jgi:hypothetical protein
MTLEELRKIDHAVQKIPYPFGRNYLAFRTIIRGLIDSGQSVTGAIRQYADWKYRMHK